MIVLLCIFIYIFIFLVYSVNYLERTSRNKILFRSVPFFNVSFLRVIVQFSSSLSNFLLFAQVSPHLFLSLSLPFCSIISILLLSRLDIILSVFLVFATSAGRLSIDYLDRTNTRMRFLSLSRSPGFSRNMIRPTQPVCRAYSQPKSLRQMRQKMPYGRRARRL